MPVSIVVGGQYGSEGKGKVAYHFAKEQSARAVVRVGGPNSGHTVVTLENGYEVVRTFRHLPTASIIGNIRSVIAAGSYINLDVLRKEIELVEIQDNTRLLIDPYAVIITEKHLEHEASSGLIEEIGSTGCGVGRSLIDRISRMPGLVFAKDIFWLNNYIGDVNTYLRSILSKGERVIIEGTQGFGLSLLHSNVYPYSTSRDTTAAGFLSEVGLSPFDVDDIILVIRTYPIRVSGNSGPMKNEITWEEVTRLSGSEMSVEEYTTVSKKKRRVAHFDPDIVKRAISYNKPTKIVLNHLDYIVRFNPYSGEDYPATKINSVIDTMSSSIGQNIDFIGLSRYSVKLLK